MQTNHSSWVTIALLVVAFVVAGGNAIVPMLPPNVAEIATGLLSVLALFTHSNAVAFAGTNGSPT